MVSRFNFVEGYAVLVSMFEVVYKFEMVYMFGNFKTTSNNLKQP